MKLHLSISKQVVAPVLESFGSIAEL